MRASGALVVLVLAWFGSACAQESAARVEVTISPDDRVQRDTSSLRMRVVQSGLPERVEEQAAPSWPAQLVVQQLLAAPDAAVSELEIGLEAFDAAGELLGRFTLHTQFVPNAVRYAHIGLAAGCTMLVLAPDALASSPGAPAVPGSACAPLPKSWHEPVPLTTPESGDVFRALVALDAHGGGFAAWNQRPGIGFNAKAQVARYQDGRWTSAEPLGPPESTGSLPLALRATDQGDAVVMWTQDPDTAHYLQRWTVDGWGQPLRVLDYVLSGVLGPVLDLNQRSDIAVVYGLASGRGSSLNGGRVTLAGERTWAQVPLSAEYPSLLSGPSVVIDEARVITLIWVQNGLALSEVRVARMAPDQLAWHDDVVLEQGDATAQAPQLVVGRDRSDVLALWSTESGLRFSQLVADASWTPVAAVPESLGVDGAALRVGVDASGHALALWPAADRIWSTHFDAESGSWSDAPSAISAPDALAVSDAALAVAPSGSAVAAWSQAGTSSREVWTSRYEPVTGWDAPTRLDHATAGDAASPQVAISPDGTVAAVWREHDGTGSRLWSARYE